MSTENLVTGKYYRILKDKVNRIYDRISFWTHSDDVETSSGATLTSDLSAKDTKISSTQSDFGSVETSSVSSHAYVKGNLLLYNNQLYRAKTAIAVGATLTVGSNIEAVTVGTLSNMLTASNGNQFNFDVKDGTPGFYPSASKTASEFVPFGGTPQTVVLAGDSGYGDAGTQFTISCQTDDIIIVNGGIKTNDNLPAVIGATILLSAITTGSASKYISMWLQSTSPSVKITFPSYGDRFYYGVYR